MRVLGQRYCGRAWRSQFSKRNRKSMQRREIGAVTPYHRGDLSECHPNSGHVLRAVGGRELGY